MGILTSKQDKTLKTKSYFIPKSKENKGKVYCYREDGDKWNTQKYILFFLIKGIEEK